MDDTQNPSPELPQPPTFPDITPDAPLTRLGQRKSHLSLSKGLAAGGIIATGLISALILVQRDQDIRNQAKEPTKVEPAALTPPLPPAAISQPQDNSDIAAYTTSLSLAETYRYYQDALQASGWTLTSTDQMQANTILLRVSKMDQSHTITLTTQNGATLVTFSRP